MILNDDLCYQALLAHDRRFDGLFFVGVSTTGIYCRTVCPAKTPRRENCTFYASAAAAEQRGYRPCLRCRPELAPGNAHVDAVDRLVAAAVSRIEDGDLTERSVDALAAEMGVTGRHLRRAVQQELGVSPVELAQTHRLLLAKRLLTDTDLPVIEVAFASGFSSLRRFNALFKERYRLNPTALRKKKTTGEHKEVLRCELAYRPPLAWESLRTFLAGRAMAGVETVERNGYQRTVVVGKYQGWITVEPSEGRDALTVEVSASLAPVFVPTLARVKRLFDLAADPQRIAAHLGILAEAHPGLRVPGALDGFEMAVRAVLGQQVSVRAASTLAGRFVTAFGEPIETPHPGLTHLSPTAERVAQISTEELRAIGIPTARANTILALAEAVADGRIVLRAGADVEKTMAALKELPGIGGWTAQYVALRALGWPDAFPHTDLGIMKALGEKDPRRILEIAEPWRPWRGYAVMHLWKCLEVTP
jgi:AraC family transcriptional regulator, regulatory protein of adaptative response / DNA-3-methyladenine glycosylase II